MRITESPFYNKSILKYRGNILFLSGELLYSYEDGLWHHVKEINEVDEIKVLGDSLFANCVVLQSSDIIDTYSYEYRGDLLQDARYSRHSFTAIAGCREDSRKVVGQVIRNESDLIGCICSLETQECLELPFELITVASNDDYYVAIDRSECFRIHVFDESMSVVKEIPIDTHLEHHAAPYALESKPFLFDDNLIVFEGVDGRSRKSGRLIALSLPDGELAWSAQVDNDPGFYHLFGSEFFLQDGNLMKVFNAKTGELLRVGETDYNQKYPRFLFLPVGDYVVAYSQIDPRIQLFSADLQTRHCVVDIPAPYEPLIHELPLVVGQRLYIPLDRPNGNHRGLSYGLAEVAIEDDKLTPLAIEERTPIMQVVTEEDGETVYTFLASTDDLDTLCRHLGIRIKEVAYFHGRGGFMESPNLDKKHKGKIRVFVDPEVLPEGGHDAVTQMVENVLRNLESDAKSPGAGDQYKFNVDLRFEVPD